MSSGLMSLAYMAELGVILNLAYGELKKTRYVDRMRVRLDNVKSTIQPVEGAANDDDEVEKGVELREQLDNILKSETLLRKKSWHIHKHQDIKYCDYYAGWVFQFFDGGKDKRVAEFFLFLSGLLIILMTIFNYYNLENLNFYVITLKTWDTIFTLLLIANIVPVVFIIMGRLMSATVFKIVDSIKAEYTKISGKSISMSISKN